VSSHATQPVRVVALAAGEKAVSISGPSLWWVPLGRPWASFGLATSMVVGLAVQGAAVLGWASCAGLAIFWLTRMIQRAFSMYVLTSRRMVVVYGVVSRSASEIPLANVQESEMVQSILQRLVGVGTVVVRSAASSSGVVLAWVPEPSEWMKLVDSGVASSRAGQDLRRSEIP